MENSNTPKGNAHGQPQATDTSVTGVTRVSLSRSVAPVAPEQPQEQPAQSSSVRVVEGALRINPRTNEQTNMTTTRVVVRGAVDPSGASGILATARTPVYGGPAREITPKTMVTIPGEDGSPPYDVEVRTAVQMNLLRRLPDGSYVETTLAERQGAEATKRAAAEAQQRAEEQPSSAGDINQMTVQPLHEEIQKDLSDLTNGLSQDEWAPILASFIHNGNLDHVVGKLGGSREAAQAFVGAAQAALMAQAQGALRDILGDDLEGWAAWCAENKASEYKRATMSHIHAKTLAGYRSLAQEYLRTVPPSAEVLQRSGYEVAQHPSTGELLVRLEEGWQSVKAATKQGKFALPRAWHEEKE